jgi:hypothetical protein
MTGAIATPRCPWYLPTTFHVFFACGMAAIVSTLIFLPLHQVDYGFLFSMPGGKSHPIYTHFYRALLEYLKGESRLSTDNIIRSWMGVQAPRTVETYPQVLKSWLAFINSQMGWVLFAWIITWVAVFAFSRPKRTQTHEMHLAFLTVLKLEDFEFNRHIVRRAAEDLFDKIDVNRDEIMEIDEIINYLRKNAKYECKDFPRMFHKEVQQVIGQYPGPGGGGANQVARKGLGHRQTDNQNSISDVFGNMLSQAGSFLDKTNAALGKGSDSILNSLAAGKNIARPGADNHDVAMPSMASIGRTLSENERSSAEKVGGLTGIGNGDGIAMLRSVCSCVFLPSHPSSSSSPSFSLCCSFLEALDQSLIYLMPNSARRYSP